MMRYDDIYAAISAGNATEPLSRWAHEVLNGVATGRSSTALVRHPLGFLCLPVERTGGYGVCLHLWPEPTPSPQLTTSGIHCHSWDLLSFVLCGMVRNLRVRLVGESPTHRIFEVVGRGDMDELRATPRTVRCTPDDVTDHSAGDTYALPAGVFHTTVIPDGKAAATVVLGRTRAGGEDLSLGPLDTPTHQVRRRRCDPDETVRTAQIFARRIAAVRAS